MCGEYNFKISKLSFYYSKSYILRVLPINSFFFQYKNTYHMPVWLVMMAPQYIQYFPVIKINIFARVCLNLTTLISTPSEITDVLMHFLFVQRAVIKMLLRLFKCQFDLCFPFDKSKTRMLHPSVRLSVHQ